jgi:hypothetical protein
VQRKVICVICRGIFGVEQNPPREIVEDAACYFDREDDDAATLGALQLISDPASVDYCQRHCAWCRLKQQSRR